MGYKKILELLKKIENIESPIAAVAKMQELYENEQLSKELDQIYSDLTVREELIILQEYVKWHTKARRFE